MTTRRRSLGCGCDSGGPVTRTGLGSTRDVHERRAHDHLRAANVALGLALNAQSCNDRVANALEAYANAVAADVQLASAGGEKPLGHEIKIQAMTALASCIADRPLERPRRRFELIQGGKTRGRR